MNEDVDSGIRYAKWLSDWSEHQNPWRLLIHMARCHPTVSDAGGLGWGLRICISNKLPGDADASDPGPHLENHWPRDFFTGLKAP